METRRRLPVIAGTALSAIIIAAPAAHADDVFNLRQDCSTTIIQTADRGGIVGRAISILEDRVENVEKFLIGSSHRTEYIYLPDRVMRDRIDSDPRDSFNCSNFFDRSLTVDDANRYLLQQEPQRSATDMTTAVTAAATATSVASPEHLRAGDPSAHRSGSPLSTMPGLPHSPA